MNGQKVTGTNPPSSTAISRRDFIKVTGAILIVAGTGGCRRFVAGESPAPTSTPGTGPTPVTAGENPTPASTQAPTLRGEPQDKASTSGTGPTPVTTVEIPPADGYLLVDIEKCQGCSSCMLACSLIHEGVESLSLSRIQVMQNSFAAFPDDLTIEPCRQCVDPACVQACPTGALQADARYGNVRMVDKEACIGCGLCSGACPYTPSRAYLAADQAYDDKAKSRKCDLCANARYHWDEAGGGPDGKQACVAVCPVGAIQFTKKIPKQKGQGGYKVDLRGRNWGKLGYPTR